MWIAAWALTAAAGETSLEWTALAGLQSTFGIPLTALGSPREPATKVSVPVEASFGVVFPPGLLVRAHLGAGLLTNGVLLYSAGPDGDEELVGLPYHVDLLGSVGARITEFSVGAQGGFSWPSRPTVRGFAAWSPRASPVAVELRGGVFVPTGRRVEPTLQLLVGVTGPFARER